MSVGHVVFHLILLAILHESTQDPVVETSYGEVAGFEEMVLGKPLNTFLGVPYAQPPVGELRFKKPVPPNKWTGVRQAKKQQNICWYPSNFLMPASYTRSEDCLYMNIWAPKTGKKHPVIVFIFGGAFVAGDIVYSEYQGDILASQNDVIVVSMNYRLGFLGFLYLGTEEVPGNMGLLDQQLALMWVKENIEKFGGDPEMITLWGQSAGASSVGYHMMSPGSRHLFKRAILQSGSPIARWAYQPLDQYKRKCQKLIERAGCDTGLPMDKLLVCLRSLDPNSLMYITDLLITPKLYTKYGPILDGEFITEDAAQALENDEFTDKDVLFGTTTDEGSLVVPFTYPSAALGFSVPEKVYDEFVRKAASGQKEFEDFFHSEYDTDDVDKPKSCFQRITDISTDGSFICPSIRFVSHHFTSRVVRKRSPKVFQYQFDYTPGKFFSLKYGVHHASDIKYVFGVPLKAQRDYRKEEIQLSQKMMTYWANFAKYGDPNGEKKEWPEMTSTDGEYLILDVGAPKVGRGRRSRQCVVLDELERKIRAEKPHHNM